MTSILKFLLSTTTLAICAYGVSIFGLSMWPVLFSLLSIFLLVSIYFTKLNTAAAVLAKTMGVLSLLAFSLLLLAATTGGSFRMSESNQIIAVALALMALFGCSFFLVKTGDANT